MAGEFHQEPDEHILSLRSKRVLKNACCQQPYPDQGGRCMNCGEGYKRGQEAYEVVIQLPNGVSIRDPQIQDHLSQVVPPNWPGFIPQLESSDRDSSSKKNTYKLILFKRNGPITEQQAFASFILPQLVKISDRLDGVRDIENATVVDGIIKSITASHECEVCDNYHDGINRLVQYLLSPKFHEDTTVQVQDVLNRLGEIESEAWLMASPSGPGEPIEVM